MPQPTHTNTYTNRLVDYLLTDGPSNRYALICSNCHGHNGLAIKEDFEYLSMTFNVFRVSMYCYIFAKL